MPATSQTYNGQAGAAGQSFVMNSPEQGMLPPPSYPAAVRSMELPPVILQVLDPESNFEANLASASNQLASLNTGHSRKDQLYSTP